MVHFLVTFFLIVITVTFNGTLLGDLPKWDVVVNVGV